MTTTFTVDKSFAYIDRLTKHGSVFAACAGIYNRVILATRGASTVNITGVSDQLTAQPLDIVSNGTPSAYYVLTPKGITTLSATTNPTITAESVFDTGSNRWLFYSGGNLIAPLAQGGVRLQTASGTVLATLSGILCESTAAAFSGGVLYVFCAKTGKMAVVTVTATALVFEGLFDAPNCRDILRAVIDGTDLYCLNRNRVVRFSIATATSPTLGQDYGKSAVEFTDVAVVATGKLWFGFATSTPGVTGPEFFGPLYGVWDSVSQEIQTAAPRMSAWMVNNVIPYYTSTTIPTIIPTPPPAPVVPPVVVPPVIAPPPPVITSALTASVTEDTGFSYTITATGTGPITYGVVSPPTWLISVNAITGAISGTPPDPGTFNITITATNAGGTDTKTLVVTVGVAVAPFGAVSVNNQVLCIVQADNLLYIGGDFTTVTDASGTVTRNFAACIDLSTALFTSWNPNCSGRINAMFSDSPTAPTAIYTACQTASSATMGGVTARVAKLHPITAVGDPAWVVTTAASQYVNCGLVIGSTVYLGGNFVTLQSTTRYSAGAVAASNAALQGWNPNNGDTVDANDRIIQYTGSLLPGVATMQDVGGSILVAGGFYVRTQAVLTDYLAVGWGYINPTTGVFSQVPSGTGETAGVGGCNHALAGANNFYVSHNLDGRVGTYDTRWRSLPEWDIPPASAYATDKWALLASGTPSIYPTYPNGGFGEGPRRFVEDPLSTDFFILGAFTTAFGVSGADRTARVSAAGARVPSFAPVWGGGSITIYGGIRRGNALILGGQFSSTLNGASRSGLTAVNATTGANY